MSDVIQEIKDRLDVVDVIASHLPMKKSGANFKARCPFHDEKTASFMISPSKQIWHCFGCGEGGDVFGFIKRIENLTFPETLKILAERAGVKLPESNYSKTQQDDSEILFKINSFAAKYYNQRLNQSVHSHALKYIRDRGVSDPTIKKWEIGFAPDDFHGLENTLASKNVKTQDLVKAGVSVKSDKGQIYDRFRDRITFPIHNYFGQVVGFSARDLVNKENSPKYINSPETSIYNKSKILFGLYFAKESIRKQGEAVIVEGQMDCISAHQAGFSNTVATSGTALTEQQLKMLSRLTDTLKFAFDNDTAGQQAAKRAGELALKQGFKLKMIDTKQSKDPDEIIRKSPAIWKKMVDGAVWFVDHYINLASTVSDDVLDQKKFISAEVIPLLQYIKDPIEQDHYIKKIAKEFMLDQRSITKNINPRTSEGANFASKAQDRPQNELQTGHLSLEKFILGGMVKYIDFRKTAQERDILKYLTEPEILDFAENFLNQPSQGVSSKYAPLAKEVEFVVESQLDNLNNNQLALERELSKSLLLLQLQAVKKRQSQLTAEIKNAEKQNSQIDINKLTKEFSELSQSRLRLEDQL